MNNSKIEWTEKTWNPITGCTKVSQGCKNCYAERMYERFHGKDSFKKVSCHQERLNIPLNWRKPSMIFVNSMSDLFHEDVPFAFIHQVLQVMWSCRNKHTFQILTKRPDRVIQFTEWMMEHINFFWMGFPEHVWIGVSIEDQKTAKERIPILFNVPAKVRFLSCEPLLGPVKLFEEPIRRYSGYTNEDVELQKHYLKQIDEYKAKRKLIHWVICGGESGPKARPMHPDWVRSLRNQCKDANIPFFFKQWGEYYTKSYQMGSGDPYFRMFQSKHHWIDKAQTWVRGGKCVSVDGRPCNIGKDFQECAYPVAIMDRVGKKNAGRKLDGRTHDSFPCQSN